MRAQKAVSPNPLSRRLQSMTYSSLAALLILSFGLPNCAVACLEPRGPIDAWVGIRGNDVTITYRNYMTIGETSTVNCAFGLETASSFQSVQNAQVFSAATGEPVQAIPTLLPSAKTSTQIANLDGGTWFGLESRSLAAIPPGQPVSIQVSVKLAANPSSSMVFQNVRNSRMVTGHWNDNDTMFTQQSITPPRSVDPAKGAPLITSRLSTGSPRSAIFIVRDGEDGLQRIEVISASNTNVTIPTFEQGSRGPVEVTVAQRDDTLPASFALKACNMFRECSVKAAVLLDMKVQENPEFYTLPVLLPTQSQLYFLNGDPGARMISFFINGRRFSLRPLIPNQILEADLAVAMISGENTMQMVMRGSPGSGGLVLLTE